MWTEMGGLLKGLVSRRANKAAAPHFARANALRDASRWREAADAYAEGLARQPERFALWVQLGNCLKEAGQFQRAEDAYMTALKLAPRQADTHLQLGHLKKLMGDGERAGEHYGDALGLGCQDFHALYFKAEAEMRQQRWRHAAELYDRLLKTYPERRALLTPLSHAHEIDTVMNGLRQGLRDPAAGRLLAAHSGLEQGLRVVLLRIRPDCDVSFLDGPGAPRALNFTRLMLDFARSLHQISAGAGASPGNATMQG